MRNIKLEPVHDGEEWYCRDNYGRNLFTFLDLDEYTATYVCNVVNNLLSLENYYEGKDEEKDEETRYDRGGMVGMDVLRAYLTDEQFEGFLRGNALKYLMRYDHKGGLSDLRKAEDYVARLVRHREGMGVKS